MDGKDTIRTDRQTCWFAQPLISWVIKGAIIGGRQRIVQPNRWCLPEIFTIVTFHSSIFSSCPKYCALGQRKFTPKWICQRDQVTLILRSRSILCMLPRSLSLKVNLRITQGRVGCGDLVSLYIYLWLDWEKWGKWEECGKKCFGVISRTILWIYGLS